MPFPINILTEVRATGIPKILRAMDGSPPPQFETDDERSSFLIRLPAHPEVKRTRDPASQVGEQVGEEVSVTGEVEQLIAAAQGQTDNG